MSVKSSNEEFSNQNANRAVRLRCAVVTNAGLEGVDAFEKLKEEAAKASLHRPPKALQLPQPKIPDPAVAKAALEVTAREGLPVTGVNAESWEALRPKIVPETKANKVRQSARSFNV